MKKSAILLAVAGLAGVAGAQTFATYRLTGENTTDAGRGLTGAVAGDVIRVRLRVDHDGHGYAGGKVEMLYTGVADGDVTISEPNAGMLGLPGELFEPGRQGLFRIVASDGPADRTQAGNEDVVAAGGKVTDVNDDFFDFASTPPGLGGLGGPFPLTSGGVIFAFDYVYGGGTDTWDARGNGEARLWRNAGDINGVVVASGSGDTLVVSPAPASLALLGMGGLVAARRRR